MKDNIEKLIDHLDKTVQIDQEFLINPQYSLIVRPDGELSNKIVDLIEDISKTDQAHFYYDRPHIHGTIYGGIDIDADINRLYYFLVDELNKLDIVFNIAGVSTTSVIMDPVNFSLFDLRRKMIDFLDDKKRLGRNQLMEGVTWLTTLRLKKEPNDEFLKFIDSVRENEFGLFRPKKVELYYTESKVFDSSWKNIFSIDLRTQE